MAEKSGSGECGSTSCLVDRLGEQLSKQHQSGLDAIRDLMRIHYETLEKDIKEIREQIKFQGDEVFPRLRVVEEEVKVIKALDSERVKTTEETKITEAKIKELISTDPNIVWLARQRSWSGKVSTIVIAALILSFLGNLPNLILFIKSLG